jgi:hypothetical protein
MMSDAMYEWSSEMEVAKERHRRFATTCQYFNTHMTIYYMLLCNIRSSNF